MLVVAAIAVFLSIAAELTSQFGRYAGRQQGVGMEAAFSDAALEYAYGEWKQKVQAAVANSSTVAAPAASLVQPSTADFLSTFPYATQMGVDTSNWSLAIYAVDPNGINEQSLGYSAASVVVPTIATQSTGAPTGIKTNNVPGYPGWSGTSYNYKAVVTVHTLHYGLDSSDQYRAVRYFQFTQLPLCQGLAFYEGNMEIHPGAKMVLNGPIHSNGKIWAQGFLATIQFTSNVSDVGGYYDGTSNPAVRYGWDGKNTAATNPDPYAGYYPVLYADGLPAQASPNAQPTALGKSAVAASQVNPVSPINPFGPDANTSNNALRSIITVPTASTAYSPQIAYDNASVVVTVNSNSLLSVAGSLTNQIDPTAITIQVRNPPTALVAPNLLVTMVPGSTDYQDIMAAINNGQTTPITDKREATTAYVTNLDMSKLLTATTAPTTGIINPLTNLPVTATNLQVDFNPSPLTSPKDPVTGKLIPTGTVYIHDVSGRTGATRGAVRLTNGAALGENVSVASDNGVYIQGDYNTGVGVVPSDGSGTAPQVTGYNRYAASVMADAVTILSNGWKDGNSGLAIGSRIATPTTVNTAILAGDVASNTGGDGIASGGVHNFPRFLENWTNINFTYYGSLIEAFNSAQYTGEWQTNDVYTWPNRLWNYDTNFSNVQPPGLPQGAQYSRGRWERSYLNNNS